MNPQLIGRLSVLTEEELRLQAGLPLEREGYTQGASLIFSSQKLLPPSRMITIRPHTRFAAFPAHSHDYVEILYMLRGKTVHELPGREPLTLSAGELLMMNCQATHAIRLCGEEDVGVNFIVQPAFFDEALAAVGPSNALGRFLMDALKRGESTVPYLHFRVAQVQAIQSLLESILFSLLDERPAGQRMLKTTLTLLMMNLLEHTGRLSLPETAGNALVVAVLEEIRQNYATISLKDFAAAHHVSAAYLSQTVRRATGESCTRLIQRQRMARAKRLLRETDLSVGDVCAAVGYANTGHFYHLFQEDAGMSPKEYREVNSGR